MSPEHFGITAPKQMDVFCLGGTLIFAATGHYPFNGTNSAEWRDSILFSSPDFAGLSVEQISLLSPLLYKKPEDRGSLENFSLLLSELTSSNWESDLVTKELARIKNESQYKLIGEKKQLAVKKISMRRTISAAAIVSLFSIGLVSYGIVKIQDRTGFSSNQISRSDAETIELTPDQIQKVSACKNLVATDDYASAAKICAETAELGDAWSQYSLGFALDELGKEQQGETWVLKAAKQKMPEALSWLAYDALEEKKYPQALDWAKQAADLGDLPGIHAVGYAYAWLEQNELAAEWYEKAWELGDALGLINLGYHYRFDSVDKVKAEKWLRLAAETKSTFQAEGSFDYAEFLRDEGRKSSEFCPWYKESADAKYRDGDSDAVAAFKKYCASFVQTKKPSASSSPGKVVPIPKDSAKPSASTKSFKVSAPLSPNVKIDDIFGSAFIDSLNYWVIPLTITKGAKVPEINAVQFRLIGYPDAGWLDVPYKLKTDTTFGTVYAQVDDILFSLIFKDQKYCPEFRVVREESGKIVHIWNKGQPDCATDYNP